MTDNQIKINYLVESYRYKYSDDKDKLGALNHILWYSYPVVYPDWFQDNKSIQIAMANRKASKKRTAKYLRGMFESYDSLIFVTLTFSDSVLSSTTESTRKQYVSRFLNRVSRDYYANIDYGSTNGREHYHAVVSPFGDSLDFSEWKYGSINAKRIKKGFKTVSRISTYMRKLVNHANKIGTGKAFHKRMAEDADVLPF